MQDYKVLMEVMLVACKVPDKDRDKGKNHNYFKFEAAHINPRNGVAVRDRWVDAVLFGGQVIKKSFYNLEDADFGTTIVATVQIRTKKNDNGKETIMVRVEKTGGVATSKLVIDNASKEGVIPKENQFRIVGGAIECRPFNKDINKPAEANVAPPAA